MRIRFVSWVVKSPYAILGPSHLRRIPTPASSERVQSRSSETLR